MPISTSGSATPKTSPPGNYCGTPATPTLARLTLKPKAAADAPTETGLATARESLLAAEGSDWCWWFGPEHSTANDAEFDALYRKHLTAVYLALGQVAPEELAKPIKRQPEHALQLAPANLLNIKIDGRDTSYFEWLGAGLYSPERRGGSMHGRVFYLHELRYGFEDERFCVRIDPFAEAHRRVGRSGVSHHHRRRRRGDHRRKSRCAATCKASPSKKVACAS